jgi:hypothetical protein
LRSPVVALIVLAAVLLGRIPAAAAPAPLQRDDFQDGTTEGWANGSFAVDPVNVPSGGPAGAADRYLKINAKGGTGGGSRLLAFNRSQWAGDYAAASISGIEMDLLNPGTAPLTVRIAIEEALGSGFASTRAFPLPADGAWHHAAFSLSEDDLTQIGSVPLGTILGEVEELRILHSAKPSLIGDALVASLGVDNVTAVAPGSFQRPSDLNQDGRLDLSDVLGLLFLLFAGGPPPLACGDGTIGDPGNLALLDANGDGAVDISDPIRVLEYLFLGKAPPVLGASCAAIAGCPDNSASCAAGG